MGRVQRRRRRPPCLIRSPAASRFVSYCGTSGRGRGRSPAALVRRGRTKVYPTRRLKLARMARLPCAFEESIFAKGLFLAPRSCWRVLETRDAAVAVGTALAGGPPHRSV